MAPFCMPTFQSFFDQLGQVGQAAQQGRLGEELEKEQQQRQQQFSQLQGQFQQQFQQALPQYDPIRQPIRAAVTDLARAVPPTIGQIARFFQSDEPHMLDPKVVSIQEKVARGGFNQITDEERDTLIRAAATSARVAGTGDLKARFQPTTLPIDKAANKKIVDQGLLATPDEITTDTRGFLMPDGQVVDIGNKLHPHVSETAFGDPAATFAATRNGAVRINTVGDKLYIDVGRPLTESQKNAIRIMGRNKTVVVDAIDINDMMIHHEGSYAKVIDQVDDLFGISPASKLNAKFNITKSGKAMETKALRKYGQTRDPMATAYITSKGKLIDGSGYKLGSGDISTRLIDHREISNIVSDKGGTEGMVDFMNKTGSVRTSVYPDDMSVDFTRKPNPSQMESIKELTSGFRTITADAGRDKYGQVIGSFEGNFQQFAKWIGRMFK